LQKGYLRRIDFWTKTPAFIQKSFPKIVWKGPNPKSLYLTFDDGPTPGVTDWVLDLLKEKNAKATFFCIGSRVARFPALYQRILDEGHAVGNHTQTHPNGRSTENSAYFSEIAQAAQFIDSTLFRPPYGKLKFSQYQRLKSEYKIVLWDVLTWDFNAKVSSEKCWTNVKDNVVGGSVIVYHDKESCLEKLQYGLPKVFEEFGGRYGFERLEA